MRKTPSEIDKKYERFLAKHRAGKFSDYDFLFSDWGEIDPEFERMWQESQIACQARYDEEHR